MGALEDLLQGCELSWAKGGAIATRLPGVPRAEIVGVIYGTAAANANANAAYNDNEKGRQL